MVFHDKNFVIFLVIFFALFYVANKTYENFESNGKIIELNEKNFSKKIKGKNAMVAFYASWCGHCKNLMPKYQKLAEHFGNSDVNVYKVNCDGKNKKLVEKFEVNGFPTIKFFKKGSNKSVDYNGDRSTNDMVEFVDTQMNKKKSIEKFSDQDDSHKTDNVRELTDKDFDDTVSENAAFVVFYAPWCGHCKNLMPTLDKLGSEYEDNDDVSICKVNCDENSELASKHDVRGFPTIYLFTNGGKKKTPYQGNRSLDDIKDFIQKNISNKNDKEKKRVTFSLPEYPSKSLSLNIYDLTENTFDQVTKDESIVMFYAHWCGHCKTTMPSYESLAKKMANSDVNIARIEGDKNQKLMSKYNITGFPTIVKMDNNKVTDTYKGNRTLDDMHEWATSKYDNTSQVVDMNSRNFPKYLKNGKMFVVFYAPWCGHSRNFMPILDNLSSDSRNNITIGRVNCDDEKELCRKYNIQGFPTSFLMDGKKAEPHNGERTVDSILEFISDTNPQTEHFTNIRFL